MWFEIDRASFEVKQQGFDQRATRDGRDIYVSAGAGHINGVQSLTAAEYCQAIEVDRRRRIVSFGRDYLGHYPLLYAHSRDTLFISDEIGKIREWLTSRGQRLTLSEEAIALYFAMGYVPQGMTLHAEIKTCRNASIYHWKAGRVTHESTFKPVACDAKFPMAELGSRIHNGVEQIVQRGKRPDVWCSGGLDSSIVAVSFYAHGCHADLLTLTYDGTLPSDESELRFAEEMARHVGAKLRYAQLNRENYCAAFEQYAATHVGPVVDYLVPLKYALAGATREIAVTGEGGDPLFSGAKNNFILYLRDRRPELSIGKIYALAHKRLYDYLPELLRRGDALAEFVDSYLAKVLSNYPGELVRKLFYVNTFEKQGGMIFPKNYYAARHYGIEVLHPLTSLDVYHAAFSLPDDQKYVYPAGKLALIALYKDKLPQAIIHRKKSGTRLPLDAYVNYLTDDGANLDALRDSGFFFEDKLTDLITNRTRRRDEWLLLYGLLSLNAWMTHNGAASARPAFGTGKK